MGALSVTSLFLLGERSFLVAILDIDEITLGKGATVSIWVPELIVAVMFVNGLVIIVFLLCVYFRACSEVSFLY
ncbi:MAG: putative membrane protein YhhN [Bacillariaceae sp.]|jgi:uncharacterized membrane protein YhhN